MAKYDYICEKCGIIVEVTKSMSDDTTRYCNCGNELRRFYGNSKMNFILNGGGFHKNDYS